MPTDCRINTCKTACYKGCHRLYAKFLCLLFAHYYNGCCTIIDTGCITCCYEAALVDRTELCKTFDGRSRTRALILIKYDGLFFLLYFYRNDLLVKCACFLCCAGLLLAL